MILIIFFFRWLDFDTVTSKLEGSVALVWGLDTYQRGTNHKNDEHKETDYVK